MRRIERFTLLAHTGDPDTWPLDSLLIADGEATSERLPGVEILEQFEIIAGYLLVTDYDCPFEETFHFILLDRDLRTVSRRSLGARFSFVPDGRIHLLQELRWEDDWHFVVILTDCPERWRFTIRKFGIPFLHPRLDLNRL
jgi:hypothetical protein